MPARPPSPRTPAPGGRPPRTCTSWTAGRRRAARRHSVDGRPADPDRATASRTCHLIRCPLRLLRVPTRAPRGRARPAVLAACSLPRRTAPADLHLGRANDGDAPPDGRPERCRAATQRDPPRPAGAPPTSRWHARTCPARPPTPRPLQTGGRSLRTCLPATRGLTARVAWEDDHRDRRSRESMATMEREAGTSGEEAGAQRGRKRCGAAIVPMAAGRTAERNDAPCEDLLCLKKS